MISFKGKILFVSENEIYISKADKIYKSIDNGKIWELWIALPVSFFEKIKMRTPLLSRLLRKSIHHLTVLEDMGIIIANKESYIVRNNTISYIEPLHGSRPMVLCKTKEQDVLYGEYRSNPERSEVHVWKFNKLNLTWDIVWSFDNVRHIHGIFYDEYTNSIWITTGDDDKEAGIYVTKNNFKTVEKVVGGSQQFRAVQLLFSENFIYFGSDAPDEKNYIYRMYRDGTNIEKLAEVGSSVFYGTKVNNSYFFSTAIEPSSCNQTKYSEIWRSDDGSNWYIYKKKKKDMWSMKYFQYGQIFFPNGESNKVIYYSPFATHNSGNSYCEKL
ncbi:hypothetical protein [Sulfurovum sp.]|uniref:hypothetical protein n=1 Tax=Sulfurovum sp. TaxID=1969726 RepID=UPI002A362E16|nr:hypothetical protein [Sulfurovum sp.]MDY0402776.1 hypothetical protein [Sulfurovum sp.]